MSFANFTKIIRTQKLSEHIKLTQITNGNKSFVPHVAVHDLITWTSHAMSDSRRVEEDNEIIN